MFCVDASEARDKRRKYDNERLSLLFSVNLTTAGHAAAPHHLHYLTCLVGARWRRNRIGYNRSLMKFLIFHYYVEGLNTEDA